ncbi:uncharacterized protein LOC143832692 isoform X1 [Paroedura picta]|uniref:uncharacterized protein LOC143832692 isoform X1 n=1 Tax=Paroedura picta TaxID=143630 RepID=UPI004056833C
MVAPRGLLRWFLMVAAIAAAAGPWRGALMVGQEAAVLCGLPRWRQRRVLAQRMLQIWCVAAAASSSLQWGAGARCYRGSACRRPFPRPPESSLRRRLVAFPLVGMESRAPKRKFRLPKVEAGERVQILILTEVRFQTYPRKSSNRYTMEKQLTLNMKDNLLRKKTTIVDEDIRTMDSTEGKHGTTT